MWNCIEDYKTKLQLSQASYPCGNFSDTQILLLNSCEIVLKISKQNYSCHKPVIPVVIFLQNIVLEDYKTTLQPSYPCGNFSDTQILLLNSCEIVLKISKQNYSCHKPVIPVVIFLTPKFFY